MESLTTLDQFLTQAGVQYQVYDLGRRVVPLDPTLFQRFEATEQPYPYPRAQHAWLGILFWDPQRSTQHFVWFLKLPLDEQGKLNPAARSQFLQMVVEALGQDPAAAMAPEQQERLNNNPFTFTPTQEKMALFHARVRQQLAQPPTVHCAPVQAYLCGHSDPQQWPQLGLQGFADYLCRFPPQDIPQVVETLKTLPPEPRHAFASVCEHLSLNDALADAWLMLAMQETSGPQRLMAIRAIAGCPLQRQQGLDLLLDQPTLDDETLIAIAARLWQGLDPGRLNRYLGHLAEARSETFEQIFVDLVAIPQLRGAILALVQDPARPKALADAILCLRQTLRSRNHV
ncbi:DUF3549 family protein [Ferrimonas gelatinilytica]|uniref:DUF3549 family protein n=1 Tax=Ferrimonas gelatinilytica TaxID=1255257 RepID=A0ABP9S3U6_9GAMM